MLGTPRDGRAAPAGCTSPPAAAPDPPADPPVPHQVQRPTRIERLLGCGVPLALLFDLADPTPDDAPGAVVIDLQP